MWEAKGWTPGPRRVSQLGKGALERITSTGQWSVQCHLKSHRTGGRSLEYWLSQSPTARDQGYQRYHRKKMVWWSCLRARAGWGNEVKHRLKVPYCKHHVTKFPHTKKHIWICCLNEPRDRRNQIMAVIHRASTLRLITKQDCAYMSVRLKRMIHTAT